VTKKVIGTLEQAKGIIKVTRIKSGYSYARPLTKEMDFKEGDPIRRYENLRAVFWDYTDHGRMFYGQLQSALPGLKWQDYDVAQQAKPKKPALVSNNGIDLYFILTPQQIEVRDVQFYRLHGYHSPKFTSGAIPTIEKNETTTSFQASSPARKVKSHAMVKDASENLTKGLKYQASLENTHTVGELPGTTIMADFVEFGGHILMAATDGSNITILNVSQQVTPITTGKPLYPGQILALKWWYPSENEPIYLSVLIWSDNEALSTLFRLDENKLVPVIKRIHRILGTFDVDGDKRPETLLGQEFDNEYFFGRRIKQVRLVDGKIRYNPVPMDLPTGFTVLGSHVADLTGDKSPETMFIRYGILYIYSGKKLIYTSPKQMGGSISFLTYDVDPDAKNVRTTSMAFEISPITMDLDRDGLTELVAVASEKSFLHAAGIAPSVKKSWLGVVKPQNGRFHLGTLGNEMSTPVQGLGAYNRQVYFVTSETGSSSGKANKSYLFAYPIAP
ncbi:MAG: hypothetical protein JSW04_10760, partial [Desulfobacterales bacterium]